MGAEKRVSGRGIAGGGGAVMETSERTAISRHHNGSCGVNSSAQHFDLALMRGNAGGGNLNFKLTN